MKRKILFFVALVCLIGSSFAQDFKPSGKVKGAIFGDYYYVAGADTGFKKSTSKNLQSNAVLKKAHEYNAFVLRRANFGYEYTFAPTAMAYVAIEADESVFASTYALTTTSASGNVTSATLTGTNINKDLPFLKDAFIKWTFIKNHDLYIGRQGSFMFEGAEKNWGLRWIEKTIMDLRGIEPSRDNAVSVRGKFLEGKLMYSAMLGNNSGTGAETDLQKKGYMNLGYKITDSAEVFVFADYLKKADAVKANVNKEKYSKDEKVMGLYAGIRKAKFAVGIEGFYKITNNNDFKVWNESTSKNDTANQAGAGISIFASYNFNRTYSVFARYDFFDPNIRAMAVHDYRHYIMAGATFNPIKNIYFSPNVLVESYEQYWQTLPGTPPAPGKREYKPSIWPRLTFSCKF